jgi:acetylglutamate kinase
MPEPEIIDIGHVGEVDGIDPAMVDMLDKGDFIPVIAPIGVGEDGPPTTSTPTWWPGKMAEVLNAEKLMLLTNTTGVLDGGRQAADRPDSRTGGRVIADGTIHGGMLPKIALRAGRGEGRRQAPISSTAGWSMR